VLIKESLPKEKNVIAYDEYRAKIIKPESLEVNSWKKNSMFVGRYNRL
jgi:hypothetical protein